MPQNNSKSKVRDNYREELEKRIEDRQNRQISDSGRKLAQYIQDLYSAGARLWTKDMFRDIEIELAKEPRPDSIMIRSMNGEYTSKKIPPKGQIAGMGQVYVHPHYKIYQEIVYDAEEQTFETDFTEQTREADDDDQDHDKAIATRALTLAQMSRAIPEVIDYPVLKAAWDEALRKWLESATCKDLTAIFVDKAQLPKETNKIVCFGLGGLEFRLDHCASGDRFPSYDAMTQHAAALTLAEILGRRLGTAPLPVLAQDPAYSLEAKRLLTDAGIEVVGGCGSLAFTHVDEGTVVFSCHPNIPVKQVVADIARPAVMIWNRVEAAEEEKTNYCIETVNDREDLISPWSTDEDSPRTRKMVEDYVKFDFPTQREHFGDLEIYVRA